jgi:hypothetical protein
MVRILNLIGHSYSNDNFSIPFQNYYKVYARSSDFGVDYEEDGGQGKFISGGGGGDRSRKLLLLQQQVVEQLTQIADRLEEKKGGGAAGGSGGDGGGGKVKAAAVSESKAGSADAPPADYPEDTDLEERKKAKKE